MGHQKVRAKTDEAAYPIGPMIEDCAVEIRGADAVETSHAERTLRPAERLGPLVRRQKFVSLQVRGRDNGELDISAPGVVAAGQRIEQPDGSGDLGGVRLLLQPAPGHVGHWAGLPEHFGGVLDFGSRHTGYLLDGFRVMVGTDLGPQLEYGAADDRAFGRRDIEPSKKGIIRSIGTKSGNYRPVLSLGPGHIILRRRRDPDIRRPQKPPAILTHQNWCVRPGPDEACVV